MVAYESYKKAMELDTRGEYTDVIKHNYIVIAQEFFSQGVAKYNEQDFMNAADKFYTSYTISNEIGQLDTMALQNTAIAYDFAEEHDKALEKYMELIEVGYNKADVYNTVAQIYINQKEDTLTGEEYLAKGRELYPGDQDLLITETNLALARGEDEKAIENLQQALVNDPTNTTIWHALGTSNENIGNMEEAEKAYLKCIEVDPTYADAYYNVGAMYSNQAAEILEEAYELPLEEQEKYDAMMAEAQELLKKSYPFLEKFLELTPGDASTLQTLKQIYTILKMDEELKAVNDQLAQ
jgi:tetratricopeptide (TPR) repeat protein